jgi:hypothetical protein
MPQKLSKKAKSQRSREQALLEKVHLNAAGIDVGAATHWVAVLRIAMRIPCAASGCLPAI